MADVDMTDAPSASIAKKAKSGEADAKSEGKKRFEVKKVRRLLSLFSAFPFPLEPW